MWHGTEDWIDRSRNREDCRGIAMTLITTESLSLVLSWSAGNSLSSQQSCWIVVTVSSAINIIVIGLVQERLWKSLNLGVNQLRNEWSLLTGSNINVDFSWWKSADTKVTLDSLNKSWELKKLSKRRYVYNASAKLTRGETEMSTEVGETSMGGRNVQGAKRRRVETSC